MGSLGVSEVEPWFPNVTAWMPRSVLQDALAPGNGLFLLLVPLASGWPAGGAVFTQPGAGNSPKGPRQRLSAGPGVLENCGFPLALLDLPSHSQLSLQLGYRESSSSVENSASPTAGRSAWPFFLFFFCNFTEMETADDHLQETAIESEVQGQDSSSRWGEENSEMRVGMCVFP